MTNVFNIFVIMSIFNILNARIINDDKNIFRGVHRNPIFCLIFVGIIIAQVIIVEVGREAMKVSNHGLHYSHWIIAAILGMTTWVVAFIMRFVPETIMPEFGKKSNKTSDEDSAQGSKQNSVRRQGSSLRGVLRGSFRAHSKQGSLRQQQSHDKPNSQRKQQSSQNMAPSDKEYK